jgi:hypothetical protein
MSEVAETADVPAPEPAPAPVEPVAEEPAASEPAPSPAPAPEPAAATTPASKGRFSLSKSDSAKPKAAASVRKLRKDEVKEGIVLEAIQSAGECKLRRDRPYPSLK